MYQIIQNYPRHILLLYSLLRVIAYNAQGIITNTYTTPSTKYLGG